MYKVVSTRPIHLVPPTKGWYRLWGCQPAGGVLEKTNFEVALQVLSALGTKETVKTHTVVLGAQKELHVLALSVHQSNHVAVAVADLLEPFIREGKPLNRELVDQRLVAAAKSLWNTPLLWERQAILKLLGFDDKFAVLPFEDLPAEIQMVLKEEVL